MNINTLLCVIPAALMVLEVTWSQQICAKVKIDNITKNEIVNLTFYLATETCPQNLVYNLKVSVVTSVAMEQKDFCRIQYKNGIYNISDASRHCRLDNSSNKIKFSFEVTSLDMRVKFTVTSSAASSVTFVDIADEDFSSPSTLLSSSPASGKKVKYIWKIPLLRVYWLTIIELFLTFPYVIRERPDGVSICVYITLACIEVYLSQSAKRLQVVMYGSTAKEI